MSCGFSEYELFILWKTCYRNRWCEKHISRQDLVKGRPSDRIGKYKDAIDSLVTKGVLTSYNSQGRRDICLPKKHRNEVLEALKAHQGEYIFIKYLEYIRWYETTDTPCAHGVVRFFDVALPESSFPTGRLRNMPVLSIASISGQFHSWFLSKRLIC